MAASGNQAFQERMKDGKYAFTEDEQRVLQECRSESFWYRAFPLSIVGGASTQLLIQRGFLTPHARFGAMPKVIFGTVCGYIIGKMLYVQQCRQKFMKLENSPFGDMVRRGRGGMAGAGFGGMDIPGMPGYGGDSPADSNPQRGAALQQDTPWRGGHDQQVNMDIDTSQVGNYDSDLQPRDDKQDKREMTATYGELRNRTRERNAQNYTQVLPGHYQPKQASPASDQMVDQRGDKSQRAPARDDFQLGSRTRDRMAVNQYGDSLEKE